MGWLADESGLGKTRANYAPLTPLSHLRRAVRCVCPPHRFGVEIHPPELCRLCRAAPANSPRALAQRGIQPGDVVATLLPNIPAQAEAHFGVPACGAVLNTINTRLETDTVAYIFGHAGAKLLLCDTAFLPLAEAAIAQMTTPAPQIIEVVDHGFTASGRYETYEDHAGHR